MDPNLLYGNSIKELKKNDLFDLGIILTICALGGLDMVYEESLEKLCDFSNKCCLIHGIWDIDTSEATFDQTLLTTLVSLKRLTERIS